MAGFKEVNRDLDFPSMEHRILQFWQDTDAFEKLVAKNSGNPRWSFIDGPITANNPMGVHHAWGRTYKDVYQRFKAMQGYVQRYQNGFDCQGLWLEVEVERDLGFDSKHEIEEFGLDNFSRECRKRVEHFSSVQTKQSIRLGQWMDWDNSYYTMDDTNIEHIWYFLKRCHEKGWLYKGWRSMPWCIRCGTSLSQHELVGTDTYREVTHPSITLRLPIKGRANEYILVWTTTPWTLAANTALAVHPDLTYVAAEADGNTYYLSRGTLESVGRGKLTAVRELKGAELVGLEYTGPWHDLPVQQDFLTKVVAWENVGEEEGTGIVHIAPGCGAEDYELSQEYGLHVIVPIDGDGNYVDGFGPLTGRSITDTNEMIFDALGKAELVYRIEDYTHRYPVCWRCGAEVAFRLVEEWFISAEEIRERMLAENQTVEWVPEYGGKRMDDWLNNMGDWCISRKRFWGLPLPFYHCESCDHVTIVGTVQELEERAVDAAKVRALPELHRPWIDEIKVHCEQCNGETARIPEVGDCWLDAGIVPFSTNGYLEGSSEWGNWFPADFISEMREQIRLWFYALAFMSVTLEDVRAYRNVLIYEKVNDEHGKPMHKSHGNAIWFDEAVEKMGADVMRWLYCESNTQQNLNFGYAVAQDVKRRLLLFWNVYNFFVTYARLENFDPTKVSVPLEVRSLMDRWIIALLHKLVRDVTNDLEQFDAYSVARRVNSFIEQLSTWYVRRGRRRYWKSGQDRDTMSAYVTLYEVLTTLTRTIAPIMPFLTEEVYQNLVRSVDSAAPESIHHTEWPRYNASLIDEDLLAHMELVQRIVGLGRAARSTSKIKVRQPLPEMLVHAKTADELEGLGRLQDHILSELNVKSLRFVGPEEELVTYELKPRFNLLGPKYGRQVKAIAAALRQSDAQAGARLVAQGQPIEVDVDGQQIELQPEEVDVQARERADYSVATEEGYLVALHTEISPDLEREGMARELIHHVQNLRREADFNLSDRIVTYIGVADGAEGRANVAAMLRTHSEAVAQETLSVRVESSFAPDGAHQEVVDLNGMSVTLGVVRAA